MFTKKAAVKRAKEAALEVEGLKALLAQAGDTLTDEQRQVMEKLLAYLERGKILSEERVVECSDKTNLRTKGQTVSKNRGTLETSCRYTIETDAEGWYWWFEKTHRLTKAAPIPFWTPVSRYEGRCRTKRLARQRAYNRFCDAAGRPRGDVPKWF